MKPFTMKRSEMFTIWIQPPEAFKKYNQYTGRYSLYLCARNLKTFCHFAKEGKMKGGSMFYSDVMRMKFWDDEDFKTYRPT